MIERVVVPVDFSEESDRALVVAPALAQRAGASLELVTVAEPSDRASVEPRLSACAQQMGEETTWRIVETGGPPAAVLLAELHGRASELWCIGSHARGAFSELFIKSLSEDLVRESHVPVAVVGPHVTAPPGGAVIAVALDGSERAEEILPAVAALAPGLDMTLRLLQVGGADSAFMPSDASETGYLAMIAARTGPVGGKDIDYDVLHGKDPAHDLADYLEFQDDVAMVALATRGLIGGARLLHGSTAFELAHRTNVPVLILHSPDT